MRRLLATAVASVAATLVFSPAAFAATRSATAIRDPGTSYTLSGRTLRVASRNPVTLSFVHGRGVLVFCFGTSKDSRGAHGSGRWGVHARSLILHMRGDVSGDPGYCTAIAAAGRGFLNNTQFSTAAFTAGWRRHFTSEGIRAPGRALAHAQLIEEWNAINVVLQAEAPGSNPPLPTVLASAPALVAHLDNGPYQGDGAHLKRPFIGQAKLLYAPTLGGVRKPGFTYVIGAGSSPSGLRMALIGLDGRLYILQTKAGTLSGAFHRISLQ